MSWLERLFAVLRAWFAPRASVSRPSAPARPVAPRPSAPLTPSPTPAPVAAPVPMPVEPLTPHAKPVSAPAPRRSIESIFDEVGLQVGVPANLLRAIATIESSYGRNLHSAGSPSYGIMQINCGSRVGPHEPCTRKLPAGFMREWPCTPERLLTDHAYNIELGARLFRDGLRSMRGDLVRAIAAYNVGAPSVPRSGKIPERVGAERPREYARKVLTEWRRRGGPDLLSHEAL